MDYRRFDDTLVLRIDRGEDIVESLREVVTREGIVLASVEALGAVNDFTVGLFDTGTRQYRANRFTGSFEIVSLTGTVSEMNGEPYLHLHMSAGNAEGAVFGGHLNAAKVSATCEMVVRVIDGRVGRRFSEEVGLNLFDFT